MPRSSRHKSSKHSSRDAREYSDSEKDSTLKERKAKEESSARVSKESGSGEKRKLDVKDSKDSLGSGNGEYLEEYSSSKRRKERVDDGLNGRWNGDDDDKGEVAKKLKEKSSESKNKRRDESVGMYGDSEDALKKASGKSEGKHRESASRKERREIGAEREKDNGRERQRERKGREGKGEKLVDREDPRAAKQASEKTERNDLLRSPESDNQVNKRTRRKRDGSGDGDNHQDDVGDTIDRRLSGEDVAKDARPKDERHKEKCRDKYCENMDKENRLKDDKQRGERAARDLINSRSDDKHLRDEKATVEIRQKKPRRQDGDQNREQERDHDRDYDLDAGCQRDRDFDHEYYYRDRDLDRDHDREHDREHNRDRDRSRDRERDRDRDRDRNHDYDGPHFDDRSDRHKHGRGRKRSPDDFDDYNDTQSKGFRTTYHNMEKKSVSSVRIESDADRGRSQSRQAHLDNNVSSNRQRSPPKTISHGLSDEYRHFKLDELKYRDAVAEQRPKAISSRDVHGFRGASEKDSSYRSTEKHFKTDDGHMGELSLERSSSSKASPVGLADRSPSSTSLERRYANKTGVKRCLDTEELGRRSNASIGARDFPSAEGRLSWDLPLEKPLADDLSPAFYYRTSQSNSALIPPPPAFSGGVGSPYLLGSLEEDSRVTTGVRYKRSGDLSLGRGQSNAWRGAPNWSPAPNGYMPFQHGPHHGGFQAMMPQFPSSPLFGVRPSIDISHSGIPYHIPDADRYPSHLRPLGWQNMMDGSGPSHLNGWDGTNGVYRDESHIYGGAEWDQNRLQTRCRGWETGADVWKGQNGDVNTDLPFTSPNEDFPLQAPLDEVLPGQSGQMSLNESNQEVKTKSIETKLTVTSSAKGFSKSLPIASHEKTADPSEISSEDDAAQFCHSYLSELDISTELASPELYSRCMNLLNIEATVDENTTMLVNLKDGAKAIPRSPNALLGSSLFPAASDCVFQRAMDIYKKHRAGFSGFPIVNSGSLDVTLASKMAEQSMNLDKAGHSVLNGDAEIPDVASMNLDQKTQPLSVATTQEKPEEMVSTSSQEALVNAHTAYLKVELPDPALSHEDAEEPKQIVFGDKIDGMSCEVVNSDDAQGDCKNTEDEIAKIINSSSLDAAEGGQDFGDARCGSLFYPDGSSKASKAMMPGSNESESVILSRIHH